MPGTLFLRFSGLCAFVPNAAPNPTAVRVLLVDAKTPHSGGHDEAHVPYLVFRDADWVAGNNLRRPVDWFHDGNDPRRTLFAACDLSDQDLSIDVNNPPLSVPDGAIGTGCPNAANRDYFSWVGPIGKMSPGSGGIDPASLGSFPLPTTIAARIRLTVGTLTSFEFARDTSTEVVKWEFKPVSGGPTSPQQQALAEEVQLEIPITGNYVEFTAVQNIHTRNPSPLPAMRLAVSGPVVAWIKNMPRPDIVGRPIPTVPGLRDPDYHFDHFYDLTPAGGANIPFPLSGRCPDLPLQPAVGNPRCPPTQFDPNASA